MCRYRELSTNAVKVAQSYFSLERVLNRMSEIYEGIVSH